MSKLFYRVPELADIYDVSEHLIYKKVREGEIPAEHIGRSIRIPASYVRQIIGGPVPSPRPEAVQA